MRRYDPSRYPGATLTAGLGADGKLLEGFPRGMTIDELRLFSRRRPTDAHKRDNLHLESGSLKDASSEYKYSFRAPQFLARSLGDLSNNIDDEKENAGLRRSSFHSEDIIGKANLRSRYKPKEYLRPEGDMIFETEKTEKFIEYVLSKRPDLLRRDTQLKLEGDFESLTENKDKFITFDNYHTRPPLAKRDTNLHLEGDFLHFPEYKDVFVDFPRQRPALIKPNPWLHVDTEGKMDTFSETLDRFIKYNLSGIKPELLKRPTNLKCEGTFELTPEYKDSFKEFPIEKRISLKQSPCLRLEGELYTTPEYKDKYIPLTTMKNDTSKQLDSFKLDETFVPPVQNNEIAYVPSNTSDHNIQNSQNTQTKSEENIPVSTDNRDTNPKSTYPIKADTTENATSNETPKQQLAPDHKKRLTDISNKGLPLSTFENIIASRPPRGRRSRTSSFNSTSSLKRQDLPLTSQYIRSDSRNSHVDNQIINYHGRLKSPEMRMGEEKFESRPEYRKAYVDYLIRERVPRSRSPEDKVVVEKPPLNLKWLKRGDSSNPSYDIVRQGRDYVNPNNTDQDPHRPSSRRGSMNSVGGSPRRSESPTFRLHVTNVDEPKRGFGSRPYKKNYGDYKSSSPTRHMTINEPQQSNVVLKERSRRQWQRNTTFDYDDGRNNSFVVLDRSREQPRVGKWNSPWYNPDE